MPTLILLNIHIYQGPETVIMNRRVHYVHELGLPYLYGIKAMPYMSMSLSQLTTCNGPYV